jgi:hypothetical protein
VPAPVAAATASPVSAIFPMCFLVSQNDWTSLRLAIMPWPVASLVNVVLALLATTVQPFMW